MAYGKIDPKIEAAIAQQRGDFDAAVGRFEKSFQDLRNDFAAATQLYNNELAAMMTQLIDVRDRVKKLEEAPKLNA